MNKSESGDQITMLSTCSLAAVLFFATTTAASGQPSAKPEKTDSKAIVTAVVLSTKSEVEKTELYAAAPATASKDATRPLEAHTTEKIAPSEEEVFDMSPQQVGDATLNLLAWQRSNEAASSTPRPITGSVANRSYDRYLKSFEHPIPERLGSTMKNSAGGGAASSGAR